MPTIRRLLWRVPILMYHRVVQEEETEKAHYAISIPRFEGQMNWLKERGYRTVSLTDAARWLENGYGLPRRSVAITFEAEMLR